MAGIEKLVTNGAQIVSQAIQKSGGIIQGATKPIEAGSEKLTSALSGLATSNSCLVKKISIPQLVDETIELLSGCIRKPLNQDLSNLSPKNMVLVHATDFVPANGIIKTTANAAIEEKGKAKLARNTIHTAVNHFVEGHLFGSWDKKKYAVLMPLDGVVKTNGNENVIGGRLYDFFMYGNVKLPKGSVVVETGCKNIPKGKMKISDFQKQDGITLIQTSRTDTKFFANDIIKKMGYTQYAPYNPSFNASLLDDEKELQAWVNFANKYGYQNILHSDSPYRATEGIFTGIGALKPVNNWIFAGLNHQEKLLESLEEVKKNLACGKKLDLDIDLLYSVIKDSKTPLEAAKKIEKEFKILCCLEPPLAKVSSKYAALCQTLQNSKSFEDFEAKTKKVKNKYLKYCIDELKKDLEKYNGDFKKLQEENTPERAIGLCVSSFPYKIL